MTLGTVAAFWGVSFLFVITPGADWADAITAGLRHRTVAPAVAGLLTGHLVHTAIVAAGVAAVLSRSPHILTTLTAAGATYLLWLGIGALTDPTAPKSVRRKRPPIRRRQTPCGEPGPGPSTNRPAMTRNEATKVPSPRAPS